MDQTLPFSQHVDRYQDKCIQYLHRTKLSYDFARQKVEQSTLKALLREEGEVIDRALGDGKRDADRIIKVIRRANFLGLKANFELFLNRMAITAATYHFTSQTVGRPKFWERFRNAHTNANGALSQEARLERAIDAVVPVHGLKELTNCLKNVLGLSGEVTSWSGVARGD